MRMRPQLFLVAGVLMALSGIAWACAFCYRFDRFGIDVLTPCRILIVAVPLGLGFLFVWRSGSLWRERLARGDFEVVTVDAVPARSPANVTPRSDSTGFFLLTGVLLFLAAAVSAAVHGGDPSRECIRRSLLAAASLAALLLVMTRLRGGGKVAVGILVFGDALMVIMFGVLACFVG